MKAPYFFLSVRLPPPCPNPGPGGPGLSFTAWVQLSPIPTYLGEAEITQRSWGKAPIVPASSIRSNPGPEAGALNSPLPAPHLTHPQPGPDPVVQVTIAVASPLQTIKRVPAAPPQKCRIQQPRTQRDSYHYQRGKGEWEPRAAGDPWKVCCLHLCSLVP